MKKIYGFAFIALALSCMFSPIGCLARKKALNEKKAAESSAIAEVARSSVPSETETSVAHETEKSTTTEVQTTSVESVETISVKTTAEPTVEESLSESEQETLPPHSESEAPSESVSQTTQEATTTRLSETTAPTKTSAKTTIAATEAPTEKSTESPTTTALEITTASPTETSTEACIEHKYVATETVPQTKIGTLDDLGYTIFTCSVCGHTAKGDYEGYLDCSWRYQKANEFRTGLGRFLLTSDGSVIYFNQEGCVQLQSFVRVEGLEAIARLRAKQEAYDMYNEGVLNHSHDGRPYDYYYGSAFWGGLNCECCQAGGVELDQLLDATFREEEEAPYARQGHLRIILNEALKYTGIGAYVYKGAVVVVCEYSDFSN